MAKNQIDGECFYKSVQDLIANGTLRIVCGEYLINRDHNVMKSMYCSGSRDVDIIKVRITWTCFRRLRTLLNKFDRDIRDIHNFVNGFVVKYDKLVRDGVITEAYVLVPDDDEMAIETIKYVMPLIVSSSKPKYVVKIVIHYIKDFKHLIPYVIEYYKRMFMGFEDL